MQSFSTTNPIASNARVVQNTTPFFALFLALILATLSLIMQSSSVSLIDLAATQTHEPWHWFFLREPLACLIFLIAFSALANDKQSSTNSYLISGLHHAKRFILAAIFVLFFLGGGLIPFVPTPSLKNHASDLLFYTCLFLSVLLVFLGGIICVRFKRDLLGDKHGYKALIRGGALLALGLIILLLTTVSGKMILSSEASQTVTAIFQGGVFIIKIILVFGFFVWVRITLPRMKPDHLTRVGWIALVPLALGNVVVTGMRMLVMLH